MHITRRYEGGVAHEKKKKKKKKKKNLRSRSPLPLRRAGVVYAVWFHPCLH